MHTAPALSPSAPLAGDPARAPTDPPPSSAVARRLRKRRVARPSKISRLSLVGGGSAAIADGAIEVRDPEGRLVVRYDGRITEVSAPSGDLHLAAPRGRVIVDAAEDVVLRAARDIVQQGGRRIDLEAAPGSGAGNGKIELTPRALGLSAARAELTSDAARAVVGELDLFAGRLTTTVKHAIHHAERCETVATRWIQRSREVLREVSDMAEEQLGRAKTVVRESFSLTSRRTSMLSEEDTSIDGRRVLLG